MLFLKRKFLSSSKKICVGKKYCFISLLLPFVLIIIWCLNKLLFISFIGVIFIFTFFSITKSSFIKVFSFMNFLKSLFLALFMKLFLWFLKYSFIMIIFEFVSLVNFFIFSFDSSNNFFSNNSFSFACSNLFSFFFILLLRYKTFKSFSNSKCSVINEFILAVKY